MPIPRTLNQDFFKTWSSEMAYVLGFFAADGSMIQNQRGACFVEFTSTDRIVLEQVRRVTGSSHTISVRTRNGVKWKTAYRLQVGSKEWFDDLLSLGFTPDKSLTLAFPDALNSYIGDFIRGYFDGDGCAYFKQHYAKDRKKYVWVLQTQFISGSRPFLEELWQRLKQLGVRGGHIHARRKGAYNLTFSRRDSLALYDVMYNTAQDVALFLPRKREKLSSAIQVLGLDNSCSRSSTG